MISSLLLFLPLSGNAQQGQSVDVTAQWKLQEAENFEKKYSLIVKDKSGDSCSNVDDEGNKLLKSLRLLDSLPLTPSELCHQKRLESKIRSLQAILLKNSEYGQESMSIMKQSLRDPRMAKCTEMLRAYIGTVANFTTFNFLKRKFVLSSIKVNLKEEVQEAQAQLNVLKGIPGGISEAEYLSFSKTLKDFN